MLLRCAQTHSSKTDCITTQTKGCVDGGLDYVTVQSMDGFDATNAPNIIKAFEDRAATCDPTIAQWAATPDGLRGIVKGTLASGGACTAPATTDGKVVAAYLASCANGGTTACLPHPFANWYCTALSSLGGMCFTDVNCDPASSTGGAYCNNDVSAPIISDNWKCVARKAVGESCQSSNQCQSLLCTKGATSQNPGVCLEATPDTAYCIN
jgi:hypothetical protein